MLSCDTNILAYAFNATVPEHPKAYEFLNTNWTNAEFAISELVLVEFYNLVRNPAVFRDPPSPEEAVRLVQLLRRNQHWKQLHGIHQGGEALWAVASQHDFPRRAIFDARLAYSLHAEGVKRFATRNVRDFARFEVFEAFSPI